MAKRISRRDLLKTAAATGASYAAADRVPRLPAGAFAAPSAPNPSADRILALTTTNDVFVPPKGGGFFKFSFDFPEPSVAFEGLQISFRIYTFENTYALDRERMTVEDSADGIEIRASQFVWAGGQEKAPGQLRARVSKKGPFIEWSATAEMLQPIKSVAAIVRGVPRGKISAGGGSFFDPGDSEILLGYPFGGGSLFTARGMNSPIASSASQSLLLPAWREGLPGRTGL